MKTAMVRRTRLYVWVLAALAAACGDDSSSGGTGGATGGSGGTAGMGGAGTGGSAGTGMGDAGTQGCQLAFSSGSLNGRRVENTCAYLGIPYAEPPVGALRFTPPVAADTWQGVRDATAFGPSCMQKESLISGGANLSEDCLSLNVYTPAVAPAAKLPVMVLIHGGGYTAGTSSTYDGHVLSEKGVVVVTMNYRLGAFGYFVHMALDAERPDAPPGIDGIRDQQLALRWVRDNIAAFQGDPDNVTIFGQSAGSFSATIHLVAPASRDLARRFILESGAAVGSLGTVSRVMGEERGAAMASELCPDASDVMGCLRGLPAEKIVAWTGGSTSVFGAEWAPVVEGVVLPDLPQNLINKDDYNQGAEIIAGTNKNEWGLFQQPAFGGMPIKTIGEFNDAIYQQFSVWASDVVQHYPVQSDAQANDVYVRLMTDAGFRCPTRLLARMLSAHRSKVFLYSFEEGNAYHGDELPYVFGLPTLTSPAPVPALVTSIQGYWTRFATTGDPDTSGQPMWAVYDMSDDHHLALKNPPSPGSGLAKAECDFWDTVGY